MLASGRDFSKNLFYFSGPGRRKLPPLVAPILGAEFPSRGEGDPWARSPLPAATVPGGARERGAH
jgi:hypothetical protein